VAVEPVTLTMPTAGWSTRASPISTLPGVTLMSPAGSPAATASSASRSVERGVREAGLTTTALPPAMAAPTFQTAMMKGKFQGVMAPTTPIGRRSRSEV
jgi:hypothetical protein